MLACFDEIFSCTIVVFHTVVGEIKHIAVCLPACLPALKRFCFGK